MEHVIRERHDRLLSLAGTDIASEKDLLLEIDVDTNILAALQCSIKNYILDCLFEANPQLAFDSNVSLEELSSTHASEMMALPNRTPNGLLLPKQECAFSYNVVVKNAIRLVSFLGLTETCEAAYMPLNVRIPWGTPAPEVFSRAYSSLKWHSDIWAGEGAREVMLHTPIFGNLEKNGVSFAKPSKELYPDYIRHLTDYNEGLPVVENKEDYDLTMRIGKVYLVDSFLLHKTLCGDPSFRGILSFPLRPRAILESDVYTNPLRESDFIPMEEWKEFGTKRMVTTSKVLEHYDGPDNANIGYADSYDLLKIA